MIQYKNLELFPLTLLRGIVHPKMKIVIVYANSYRFGTTWRSSFCWTQKIIIWMLVTRLLMAPITLNIFFPYYGSQWLPIFF